MNYTIIFITFIFCLHFLHDVLSKPLPPRSPYDNPSYSEELEERRRKNKRRKKPCTRNNPANQQDKTNNPGDARWFLGHDLTFFFGDVTICGNGHLPNNDDNNDNDNDNYNQGIYEGVVPVIQRPPHRPHKPHRPHRPHMPHRPHRPQRPSHNRPEAAADKPVVEENQDDYVDDNYYRPGPVIGVLNNQVEGQEQNLSNFNPMSFISSLTRNINRFVNPWVDLFFK